MPRIDTSTIQPLSVNKFLKFLLNNWSRTVETESTFKTSIVKSLNGKESRKGLWLRPRTLCNFRLTGTCVSETRDLIYTVQRMASENTAVPLFSDLTTFVQENDTTIVVPSQYFRFFPGARLAIFTFNPGGGGEVTSAEVLEIDTVDPGNARIVLRSSITTTSPTTPYRLVVPLIDADIETGDETITAHTSRVSEVDIHAKERVGTSGYLPIPFTSSCTAFGYEILYQAEHNWETNPKTKVFRQSQETPIGRSTLYNTFSDRTQAEIQHKSLFCNRQEAFEFISFFQYHKGRLRPFWMEWYQEMWDIQSSIAGTITMTQTDDSDDVYLGFRYLQLTASSGEKYVMPIASISNSIGGNLTVTGLVIPPSSYSWVSAKPIFLVRFESDTLREVWRSGEACEISYKVSEVFDTVSTAIDGDLPASYEGGYPGLVTGLIDMGEPGTEVTLGIDADEVTVP